MRSRSEVVTNDVINANTSTLMFLPLAHIFATARPGRLDRARLEDRLLDRRPAVDGRAPDGSAHLDVLRASRVFEKIYNSAKQKADADGKGKIFDLAAKTAINYSTEDAGREGVPADEDRAHGVRSVGVLEAA